MSEVYNRGLFHKWVPGPGMLVLILLLLVVVLVINPIYAGNIGQMSGSTGIITEYFLWGSYTTIIGMALVLPFIMRIKLRFRSKELMITALLVMTLMSIIIATTSIGEVVVVACLVFGSAKMIGMTEMILPVQGILSPDGNRKRFYAIFYPFSIGLSQLGVFFTSSFSLNIGWQALHFYSAGILLMSAGLCIILMHNQRFARKMPFYYIDWFGLLLFATALISMAYIFSFGKQLDWFSSSHIVWALASVIFSILALIIRQLTYKHPFLSFKLYKIKDVKFGLLLLVAQGMYLGASSIMSIYTSAILGYNWITNASLNLMTLPGIVVAGFVALHWTNNKIPLRMYIFSGFAAYFLYTVILYFMMVPQLSIEQLYLPQILSGYGMGALFISIWIHTLDKVPQKDMLPSVAPVMIFRSFILMAFFTALFGWLQYNLQWQSIGNLAVYFDTLLMNNNPSIGSMREVQLSAILAANKTLLGYIIICGLGILLFVLLHQFGHQKYQIARYRAKISQKQKIVELSGQITDVAGSVM